MERRFTTADPIDNSCSGVSYFDVRANTCTWILGRYVTKDGKILDTSRTAFFAASRLGIVALALLTVGCGSLQENIALGTVGVTVLGAQAPNARSGAGRTIWAYSPPKDSFLPLFAASGFTGKPVSSARQSSHQVGCPPSH